MSKYILDDSFFAFEDLEVYQLSVDYSVDIYRFLEHLPDTKKYALVSQVKRSVTSVTLNIAEGRGRNTDKDFAKFLYQARGSLLEVVAALHLSQRLEFVSRKQIKPLYIKARQLISKLTAFIQALEKSS